MRASNVSCVNQNEVATNLYATHSSRLLKLIDVEVSCYVLNDTRRMLSKGGVLNALGLRYGTSRTSQKHQPERLAAFLGATSLKPFVSSDLSNLIDYPIFFRTGRGGRPAHGYEASVLVDICDAVVACQAEGQLYKQQQHIGRRCLTLTRAFAKTGVIALVDEATGYQAVRPKDELAFILQEYVAEEIRPWVKTFGNEFYECICKLRREPLSRAKERPQYMGHITNNLVYDRLGPDVLTELQRLNSQREHRHHQHMTGDLGHPRLREHLAAVTSAMRMACVQGLDWDAFLAAFNKTCPKWRPMPLFEARSRMNP